MAKYFGGSSFDELSCAFRQLSGGLDHASGGGLNERGGKGGKGGGKEAELSWEEIVKAAAGFRTRGKVNESSVSSHAADKAAQQMAEALTREEGRVELRQLFRQLDSDGDGRLTSEEWARGMGKQGAAMAKYFGGSTYEDLARIFSKIDANGDGSLTCGTHCIYTHAHT